MYIVVVAMRYNRIRERITLPRKVCFNSISCKILPFCQQVFVVVKFTTNVGKLPNSILWMQEMFYNTIFPCSNLTNANATEEWKILVKRILSDRVSLKL